MPFVDARPASAGHWDELRAACDEPQVPAIDAWRRFFEAEGRPDATELDTRARGVRHAVREDDAGHRLHASGASQPWPLQLLPVLLGPSDWRVIETGVRQRAWLMELVLADLYGPQRLLADALLPAPLVQAHPDYLRPALGVAPVGGTRLHVAAFDLVRMPGGGFAVLGQRLQAPSGLGYMLENRLIVGAQFPHALESLGVQRLAAGLRVLVDGIRRASPQREQARIVWLTPGPMHETWFEQAFLARHFGLTLVEGQDLTVRGRRVYRRTLRGLEPVHAIVRRVDDAWLDPLELTPESALGVPGLLQAWRAGEVLLANAPGCGVLESPGLAAFWPALAQRLLGQPLLLPATPSWWCGEASVWAAQRERLAEWVAAPSFPSPEPNPVIAAALDPAGLAALRQRIDRDPAAWTLLAPVAASQTPVWSGTALDPRSLLLRVFAIADGQGGWQVVPGGMARVAGAGADARQAWQSFQQGSGSADCWVVTGEPVVPSTLRPAPLSPDEVEVPPPGIGSRAAENLFWLGRYAERVEHGLRLARLALRAENDGLSDSGGGHAAGAWLDRQLGRFDWPARRSGPRALLQALADERRPGSLAGSLAGLRRCAQSLRERLSSEHWQLVHETEDHFRQHMADVLAGAAPGVLLRLTDGQAVLARASLHLAAIAGAHADRMLRDDGWRLLSVGRQLERLMLLAPALGDALALEADTEPGGFDALLELADALTLYRARWQTRRERAPLLHLLVLDLDHPRSLAWVSRTLTDRLRRLAEHDPHWAAEVVRDVAAPQRWRLAQPPTAASLQALAASAATLSDAIHEHLFAQAHARVQPVWR